MAAVTLDQTYRGYTGHAGTYSVDTTYIEVHDKSESNVAFGDPSGMLIMQDSWFPSGSYLHFNIHRSFLYWDTSGIPAGAVIISAEIRLYIDINYTYRTHNIVVQSGQPVWPLRPISKSSYYYVRYSGNGGEIASTAISTNAWNTITLNDDGKNWINCGGQTKLALRVSRDVDADSPGDAAEGEAARKEGIHLCADPIDGIYAKLVVTYALVTTQAAAVPDPVANHSYEFADGHGTVTGDNITERGFEVKLAFSGCLCDKIHHNIAGFTGDVTWNFDAGKWEGELIKTESETGSFGAGAFTLELGTFPAFFADKLFAGESYTYRARATVGGVECYGEWVAFSLGDFPAGVLPDDQIPIDDIIVTEPPVEPIVPVVPWEPPAVEPIEPIGPSEPFIPPGITWPEFPVPDPSLPPGSWINWFYYRKAYTKKDLDDLRRKCRVFQDNSVEYALVINHNSRVLQQFLNSMTTYMGADEHNTFRPIIPTQHLNALARQPLDIIDFKEMINNFISNSIDNANNVNNNFRLIRDGLSDYAYTEDEGFRDITVTTRLVNDTNPDVDRLKKVVDRLSKEMANNYAIVNHNLHVVKSTLI